MTQQTDTQMHKDVVDELAFEPSLDAGTISVAVQHGIVTLSGHVSSYSQKGVAEQAVGRVRGIRGLAEELSVQFHPGLDVSDTDIAEAARHALAWDVIVVDHHVRIRVEQGWVRLEGELAWAFERERAQTVVAHLRGVKGVTNLITLRPHTPPGDLAHTIEAAFRRSDDMDAGQVRVEADAGKVTLRGTVHNWADIDAASLTAWRAPGVTTVDNQIVVA